MKKKIPVFSMILYALSGLFVIYMIWAIIYVRGYLAPYIESGQFVFSGNEFEAVNMYMNYAAPYLFYALVSFGLGWIMHKYLGASASDGIPADLEDSNESISDSIMYDFSAESFEAPLGEEADDAASFSNEGGPDDEVDGGAEAEDGKPE